MEPAYQILPLAELHEAEDNHRKYFNPAKLEELTESVRRNGILTPLLVRPRPSGSGYDIAAGHRRFRAATAAGLTEVPCIVRPMDDVTFLEFLTIENLQREDVHELEEAEGYEALMQRAGCDAESLALKVGKSLSYIYQRLKLLALIPVARKSFLDGEITAGHAVPLARLTAADQKTALEYLTHRDPWEKHDVGPPSVQAFRAWIGQELILDLKKAPFDTTDVALVAKAGACGPCPKRSGAQPALFADLSSRDLCTDRTCHAAKVAAHIASTTKTLEAKGETVKRLSTNHHLDPEERKGKTPPLTAYEWRKAGAITCDKTVTGIVVSGYQERDDGIGKTFRVCINPKCKTHAGHRTIDRPASKPKTAAERRAERDAADALQVDRLTLANLNEAIITHAATVSDALTVPGVLVDLLRIVACGLVREMWKDTLVEVARRRDWLPPKGADRGGDDPLTTRFYVEIGVMQAAPLLGLCIDLALGRSATHHPNYEPYGVLEKALDLKAVAKLLGIDVAAARKAAKAKVGIERAQWNTEEMKREQREKAQATKADDKGASTSKARKKAAKKTSAKKPRAKTAAAPDVDDPATGADAPDDGLDVGPDTGPACEICACIEERACEGGCSWDETYAEVGRWVCTTPICAQQAALRDGRRAKQHGVKYTGPASVAALQTSAPPA